MPAANHSAVRPDPAHNARMGTRGVPVALTVAGAAGAASAVAAALAAGEPGALLPVALALAWYVAGALAALARPEHLVARLLLAVGSTHLTAFGLSTVLSLLARPDPSWAQWLAALVSTVLFAAGFAALALLLAVFPGGAVTLRSQRILLGFAGAFSTLAPVFDALTAPRLDLPLAVNSVALPPPDGLPLVTSGISAWGAVPLLPLAGLGLLVVRSRRADADERAQLTWPLGAGTLLALLLLTTPTGTRALGAQAWTLLFVLVISGVPFALLAGLVRYRALQVDLLVGRALAYAAVLAVVLTTYVGAAALTTRAGHEPAAVAVALVAVAALTGEPVRRRLERLVDRWLTGGRVRRQSLVHHFVESLEGSDRTMLGGLTAQTVATGLDVAWVRVLLDGRAVGVAGHADSATEPQLVVAMVAGDEQVGTIECGPRHGGWAESDQRLVEVLGRHAGLALHGAHLAAALAVQVAEVTASRNRLVRAEEEARRRVERDLHDGVQQHLVVLLARLELLRAQLPPGSAAADAARAAQEQARDSLTEVRELVRGIHPPLLGDHGLAAAVRARADRLPIDVTLEVGPALEQARLDPAVEGGAYYVISEALTNVLKHAGTTSVTVRIAADGPGVQISVADRGRGFATPTTGSGLAGLRDRVEALGGDFEVCSQPGAGTTVTARLPTTVTARCSTGVSAPAPAAAVGA